MIITDSFVCLHLPKTGGTFVTVMLKEVARRNPGFRLMEVEGRQHGGFRHIPKEHQDKPVLCNIRHPLEHYVSRFEFRYWARKKQARRLFEMNRVLEEYPRFPDITFREFVHLFHDWKLRRMGRGIHERLPRPVGVNSSGLVRLVLPDAGDFLEVFDRLTTEEIKERFSHVRFLRTECLNEDLYRFLTESVQRDLDVEFIRDAGFVFPRAGGRGQRASWREYYDDELIRFVLERDRLLFRLFPRFMEDVTTEHGPLVGAGAGR